MRAKRVYEDINFERGTDPKTSMDIGMNVISNRKRIEQLYNQSTAGYYLMDQDGNYILYSKDTDDPLSDFLTRKFGEWNTDNADEWREYVITEVLEDGGEDNYTY